jgi:hypothetical protein
MIKRVLALTAAALVLVMALFSSFYYDLMQAILSSERVGPYEMSVILSARSNEERSILLSGLDFPLPNGAAAFANMAYPAPGNAMQFLTRAEAWRHYEESFLRPHTADQMGALLFVTYGGIDVHIIMSMFTRHHRRILVYTP